MHYTISIYFNYFNDKKRYTLTKDFITRYPNIILIEIVYPNRLPEFNSKNVIHYNELNAGFITNKCINKFVAMHNDIESLTFVDADCILKDGFFDRIITKFTNVNYPMFIQPYSFCIRENQSFVRSGVVYRYKKYKEYSCAFHTGLAYSYNKQMIDKVFPLPENLLLGGFDTILYICLFKLGTHLQDFFRVSGHMPEVQDFYNKFNGVKFDYIPGLIYTFEDNKCKNYTSRIALYRNINQQVIDEYFACRTF